jgi:hypothetical protein
MVLAYECLRAHGSGSSIAAIVDAEDSLRGCRLRGTANDLARICDKASDADDTPVWSRLLRARLALLLRVLLRADAVTCTADEYDCRHSDPPEDERPQWQRYQATWGIWWWRRPFQIRPLWEIAPPASARRARRAG